MRIERTTTQAPPAPPPDGGPGAAPLRRSHEPAARAGTRRPLRVRLRPVERQTESPFRRRQVRWRRRPKLLAWGRRAAAALAIAAMPVAVVVWLLTSDRFALSELTVTIGEPAESRPGTARHAAARPDAEPRVSEAWVRHELEPFLGANLLRLELDAVAEPIERHPWVRAVDVSKELPAQLRVRVAERREAALLRQGGELHYLDEEGRPIAPADPGAGADLVVVRRRVPGDADPESLAAALEMLRELEAADLARLADLEEIEILGEGDFRVLTAGLPFPLLVAAGTVEERARRLEGLLPQLEERYGSGAVVDLRFERRIIVQPSPRGTQRRGDSG